MTKGKELSLRDIFVAPQLHIKWDDIMKGLADIDQPGIRVYGVPRGGMLASAFLKKAEAVHDVEVADVILDDVIDSGATRDRYVKQYPEKRFVAIADKINDKNLRGRWLVFPWESGDPTADKTDTVRRVIEMIGEDAARDGLSGTPARVVRSWQELYCGYRTDPREVLSTAFDRGDYDEMVVLRDIEFFSTCEHHMLPFFGRAHIGYLPGVNGKVVGISKLARLVECFSRRLQIQERLTQQIAQSIETCLGSLGVAVVLEAQHFCMVARGVSKQNSTMGTSTMLGSMRDCAEARGEFLQLIQHNTRGN